MKETFVLDACALIAFLDDEDGADKVENILRRARRGDCVIYMNKVNVLEIYYGVFREYSKEKAEEILAKILALPIIVIDMLKDNVFKEAGRLKAIYKISLADSIALAETKIRETQILTADHHEFDPIDKEGEAIFYWIR
ncbi:VapC toxin family PIN domain ribonuclease [Candidatus Desantisbacteria bacterium CG2_30_40_21]|uniref:VapC toxin family PIN domain ribonuclease n=4 Tax=unclassified Candidatus Desantisiibacteriota TaxID=3106372 RepID=A0A2M7JES5_9BACT|nr:MAG: VapC toxin family PIN domain ribonuclease [Candidatus Desantisbacteria bacterium CG2_30_40_21]PIP39466.1 MAG: VapC toxin family PIN domain ribonuclease [Candidatus Desantisbacteria bacterium CG23_combo_of_CG06-09_8_20_14_all_40_23]PIX17891.1 MAG: VapC toxin family PIN domain ribonuclease [Candidatus Desantisbacteria bacterium CG_4_8_14_3_um_filter_40_12]PJB29414.1 MAG: VapC toxin family PIN domain ribonuclease [Candidatus Desantisbacteria bacterium CG_4_9_14_3_um_filter_40_11]